MGDEAHHRKTSIISWLSNPFMWLRIAIEIVAGLLSQIPFETMISIENIEIALHIANFVFVASGRFCATVMDRVIVDSAFSSWCSQSKQERSTGQEEAVPKSKGQTIRNVYRINGLRHRKSI